MCELLNQVEHFHSLSIFYVLIYAVQIYQRLILNMYGLDGLYVKIWTAGGLYVEIWRYWRSVESFLHKLLHSRLVNVVCSFLAKIAQWLSCGGEQPFGCWGKSKGWCESGGNGTTFGTTPLYSCRQSCSGTKTRHAQSGKVGHFPLSRRNHGTSMEHLTMQTVAVIEYKVGQR